MNQNQTPVPVPDNSGALDKQTRGTSNSQLVLSKPLEGLHMAKAIKNDDFYKDIYPHY